MENKYTDRKCYTQAELQFIITNYEIKGPKYCSEQLGKSYGGIQKAAKRLDLKANNQFICNNSPLAIEARKKQGKYLSNKFSVKKLTETDELKVIELYKSGLSDKQIADMYKCSTSPIVRAIKNLPKRKSGDYPNHKSKNQWGANNGSWKGGYKSVYDRIRDLEKYWIWRSKILKRDKNKCTKCSKTKNLQVHHIVYLKVLVDAYCSVRNIIPEKITAKHLLNPFFYSVRNGLTLCKKCHKAHHKKFGRKG